MMGGAYMIQKKKSGAALVVVIMVMAVLMILGTAILNISLSESKQASLEDKKVQAHYLARSGADATLNAWENSETKPSGTSTVYLNSSNEFTNTVPSNEIGRFDVTVIPPAEGGTDTVITSVGTVGAVTQTVTVTIKNMTTTVQVPPSITDTVSGDSLDWYKFTSGQINTGNNTKGPNGKAVKLEAKKSLKIPNKNSPAAYFEADKIYFVSPVQVWHNSIVLTSSVIAFDDMVDFSNNDGRGNIVLKVLAPGITRTNNAYKWGAVYFANEGYYFKDITGGITISNQDDIQTNIENGNLEKIQSGDYYLNPFIGGTKSIPSYSVLWS